MILNNRRNGNIMNSIFKFVAVVFLHQVAADYSIEIVDYQSNDSSIIFTRDIPEPGDMTFTFNRDRKEAKFVAELNEVGGKKKQKVTGQVCEINTVTPAGLVADIIHLAVRKDIVEEPGSEDCYIPAGVYEANRKFTVKSDAFDELMPGFSDAELKVMIYLPEYPDQQIYVQFDVKISKIPT